MATFSVKISGLPTGITEKRLKELLSAQGRVISLRMAGSTCTVQLDSGTLFSRLERAPTGTMGFNSFLNMDSSGLGELQAATISLVR